MKKKKQQTQAAALKYDPSTDAAPIITALGKGVAAEKIIESAEEHDVPIVQNEGISDVLAHLSVGDAIPRQLYEAVAQVLIYVSQQDAAFRDRLRF